MKSLKINGKRWFDRKNGNTYHSVKVEVDGVAVYVEPFAYGYGNQYAETARSWLVQNGHVPVGVGLWHYCDRSGIEYEDAVIDVKRKSDLAFAVG